MAQFNVTVVNGVTQVVAESVTAAASEQARQAALVARAFGGPLYVSVAAGLAATTDPEGFAVDNNDGTASVYRNVLGSAVLQRVIIIDPAAPASAASLGVVGWSSIQAALDDLNARLGGF